ncbi:MAG: LysM peptidoglycan-binding domain-containing protein [Gammaproteobacteria bacterium]|nr:LysM peptidoglycan-binding domain-containing protein [Gammaproteobacteria bacterium]
MSCLRLGILALTAAVAGCSSNPFGNDDPPPTPVTRSSSTQSGSTSLDPGSANRNANGPVVTRIDRPSAIPLAEGHPDEYTVQEGDTLWDIAATFLRDPWYWPEVWYVNPQVENPHLIYPGDVLALVNIDGRDRITTVRGSSYRLSPQARITPLDESIESIPYEQIAAFLSKGIVLEKDEIDDLPYILSVRGDHMAAAAGNEVYVRGGRAAPNGTRYSLVHVGDELVDPDDGDVIGYHGVYIGEGALSRGGDPATIALNETNREAIAGDRLIPETVDIPLNFFPKAPDIPIDGRIISVVDGVSLIGQFQVIVMNRGARHGLAPGDVLSVYQAGDYVRDRFAGASLFGGEKVKLPDEEAGTVMVFKVYDRIGYGLIMEATDAIRVLDAVRNPY